MNAVTVAAITQGLRASIYSQLPLPWGCERNPTWLKLVCMWAGILVGVVGPDYQGPASAGIANESFYGSTYVSFIVVPAVTAPAACLDGMGDRRRELGVAGRGPTHPCSWVTE